MTESANRTNAAVLILNQQPILAYGNGKLSNSLIFDFGKDTSADGSCSLVWQNQFYNFGGNVEPFSNQISKLEGCMLNRIGDLDFEFSWSSCTNFNNERVFLCFDSSGDYKKCRFTSEVMGFSSSVKNYTTVESFFIKNFTSSYSRPKKVNTNTI